MQGYFLTCIPVIPELLPLPIGKPILNNDSQESYYCDGNGQVIVDHIAEFDNLQNEFVFLCNQVGIQTPSLQHSNKSSNQQNMHDIYNQELIDIVAEKEKSVIQLKGYEY